MLFAKERRLGHCSMMKFGLWVCAAFLGTGLRAADIVITTNTTRTNLPMAPSAPRTNAFKGHQIQMGFRLELAAAEPIVNNPSAMAFDEEGRLFVVENPPGQPGRVRVLEDTAGNGNFESATVYADNLYSPTAITCSDGGIFVAASGQIIYLKDTKKDSVADVRRVVFSSFGDPTNGANGAVIITAIVRGVDNLFHVATAGRGGDIISSSAPKQSVVLSSGCFSF